MTIPQNLNIYKSELNGVEKAAETIHFDLADPKGVGCYRYAPPLGPISVIFIHFRPKSCEIIGSCP